MASRLTSTLGRLLGVPPITVWAWVGAVASSSAGTAIQHTASGRRCGLPKMFAREMGDALI